MYKYYYVKTDCRSNCWETSEIQKFLRSFDMFDEHENGIFVCKNPFIDISLMKVKDLNIWSSNDFDETATNYISIVVSDLSRNNPVIEKIFSELELLLCFRICPDDL